MVYDSRDDDKIKQIPVKFKNPKPDDKFLVVENRKCLHYNGPFLVDDSLEHIECGQCGEKLNPMWVLRQLANKETTWHLSLERYRDAMKRLDEKQRCKCQNCGQITRIRIK